jgi:hypothetical protein
MTHWLVTFQPDGAKGVDGMVIVDRFEAPNMIRAYGTLNENEADYTSRFGCGRYSLFSASTGDMNHFRGTRAAKEAATS